MPYAKFRADPLKTVAVYKEHRTATYTDIYGFIYTLRRFNSKLTYKCQVYANYLLLSIFRTGEARQFKFGTDYRSVVRTTIKVNGKGKIWPSLCPNHLTNRYQNLHSDYVVDIYHPAKLHPDWIKGFISAHA